LRDLEKFGTQKVLQKEDDHLYLVQLMDESIFCRNRSVIHATCENYDIEEFYTQVLLPQQPSPLPVPQNIINSELANNEGLNGCKIPLSQVGVYRQGMREINC